ncbi:MAG: hypothetical protein ACXWJM_06470 [Ramlibacter sp.]
MGLTLFTLGGLFGPLQGLVASLLPSHGRSRAARRQCSAARSGGAVQRPPHAPTAVAATARPCRPLRVVRIVEPARTAMDAGRMRISGRMADVCAEIDRLAALEAAAG